MKRLCTYSGCKNVVSDGGSRCELHPHQKRASEPEKKRPYQSIYSSSRWKRLRQVILSEHPLCVHCERLGLVTAATVIDHIIEISDGGAVWDRDNLQPLCRTCHQIKTGLEQRRRRNKRSLNGFNSLSDF